MTDESLVSLGGAAWRDGQTNDDFEAESGVDSETAADVGEASSNGPAEADNHRVFGPLGAEDESELPTEGLSPVNIRNFSVKCGYCGNYQVIVRFRQVDEDWNEYVYECDEPPCSSDVERSRTVLEIPAALDEYARRDPTWHGGKIHAGAQHEGG